MNRITINQTGFAEIDRQHAQLLACLTELKAFVGGKYEFAAVFTAVQTLIDYTKQHFAYEEDFLAKCAYPDLDQHIAEHQTLIDNVRHQWNQIELGDTDIAEDVVETIESWIVDHINVEDSEFAKFVQTAPK